MARRPSTKPTLPSGLSQDEVDERAWAHAPDTSFVHQPNGQMYISDGSRASMTMDPKFPERNAHGHLAGTESEPYLKRPVIPGKQLPLGRSGAFTPEDPAMHALRTANPHLNDYRFTIHPNPGGIHHITAVHTPTDTEAGNFQWKSEAYAQDQGAERFGYEGHDDEIFEHGAKHAGEVEMIQVKDQHGGRGLATAMWDYAHLHAGRDDAEVEHPKHSEIRSIEGNHWAHFVGGASMARTAGHGIQKYV